MSILTTRSVSVSPSFTTSRGMIDALVGKLRNVDQALDLRRINQLGERAKFGQLGDLALHQLADIVFNRHCVPGVLHQTIHAQANAFAIRVDADDLDFDLVANLQQFARVGDMLPGQFGQMNQALRLRRYR